MFRSVHMHFGSAYYTPIDLGGLYWHLVVRAGIVGVESGKGDAGRPQEKPGACRNFCVVVVRGEDRRYRQEEEQAQECVGSELVAQWRSPGSAQAGPGGWKAGQPLLGW